MEFGKKSEQMSRPHKQFKKPKRTVAKLLNSSTDKINPFEIHFNKQKHVILGQRLKDDKGLPGISRARALKKREATLLQEYKHRFKVNKFKDRRLGESDPDLDAEKKRTLRLQALQIQHSKKKSVFQLNDDEETLTHGGVPLDKVDLKEASLISDSEEDDNRLDAEFVAKYHFSEGNTTPKPQMTLIDRIIADSKAKKYEAIQEKKEVTVSTKALDSKLKDFMSAMDPNLNTDDDKTQARKSCSYRDYDKYVGVMTFDPCAAVPSERLKTTEELEEVQQQKKVVQDTERLWRMQDDTEDVAKQQGYSADSLFVTHPKQSKDERDFLRYSDGKAMGSDVGAKWVPIDHADEEEDEGLEDREPSEEDKGSEEDEEEEEDYSDIMEESNEENVDEEGGSDIDDGDKAISKKSLTESVKTEKPFAERPLPLTFEVPESYEAFLALIRDRTPADVSTITRCMIASSNKILIPNSFERCNRIFAYLLQTVHVMCSPEPEYVKSGVPQLEYVDAIVPHLYTLSQIRPQSMADTFTKVIDEKYEDYKASSKTTYPYADTLIFLKIASLLYPATDFRHFVLTRIVAFMAQMLYTCRIRTRRHLVSGFFVACTLFEYISETSRFVPELLNFMRGILCLSLPAKQKCHLWPNPPFRMSGEFGELLLLKEKVLSLPQWQLAVSSLNQDEPVTDDFKVRLFYENLNLIVLAVDAWKGLPSAQTMFTSLISLLSLVELGNYPEETMNRAREVQELIAGLPPHPSHLQRQAKRPRVLKMYDPEIEEHLTDRPRMYGTSEEVEMKKLQKKVKKERRGAKREILRDSQFLAAARFKEQMQSDFERKRKLEIIMSDLRNQDREFKRTGKKRRK